MYVLPSIHLVTLKESRMATTLTSKGQVTIPKHIRDALRLLPGAAVEFSVNAAGEVVLHPPKPSKGARPPAGDRFDAVRGRADVHWRTDALMKLLRADE
jgi:antitoxin PrlF